jgi:hypothetical protein
MPQPRDLEPITVYLPADIIEQLEQQARESYLSVSAVARNWLISAIRGQASQKAGRPKR